MFTFRHGYSDNGPEMKKKKLKAAYHHPAQYYSWLFIFCLFHSFRLKAKKKTVIFTQQRSGRNTTWQIRVRKLERCVTTISKEGDKNKP